VAGLRTIFSEYGLIRFRVAVECRWLQHLSKIPEVDEVPVLSAEADGLLDALATNFTVEDALLVKISHNQELKNILEFVHFACTSEDINNLSHALMLQEAMEKEILPVMDQVIDAISTCVIETCCLQGDDVTKYQT
jgi:adenylosuccinate lyase